MIVKKQWPSVDHVKLPRIDLNVYSIEIHVHVVAPLKHVKIVFLELHLIITFNNSL